MIYKEPILLNRDFNEVLNELEQSRDPYFITGKAGTGKSTLLSLFRNTSKKRVVVLAPTGVAALNVRGQTIHSFFGFPPKLIDSSIIKKVKNRSIYTKLDTIIIDEISMVRADIMDHIDYFLRLNRNSQEPFGGVQMLFFGDLFQLPPVVASLFEKQYFSSHYPSPYFFDSHVMSRINDLRFIELTTIYRQKEKTFIQLLDMIRQNEMETGDMEYLNTRVVSGNPREPGYITLTARNAKADLINRQELLQIDQQEFIYRATTEGMFDPRLYPTDPVLRLKKGAQIMFIRNDPNRRFVNGTIGQIETLTDQNIGVSIKDDNGKKQFIEVEQAEWEILKYKFNAKREKIETDIIGVFRHFPIKLAWAVTIHKSQGKTFDQVIIDLGQGAFEHGQTYVALSRCRSFEGIRLTNPVRFSDILVDPRIVNFYENCHRL